MDPYKVLGVSPSSTDDEVKSAYRSLAKKYHPDAYANNPLADLAAEKMKEINQAYDQVTKMRSGGGSGGTGGGRNSNSGGGYGGSYGGGYSGPNTNTGYSTSNFRNVRDLINADRTREAQSALDNVDKSQRDAEWHFLRGCVYYKVGWVKEAYLEFQNAVQMDSGNSEYREAYERLASQMNGGGFSNRNPYGGFGGYGGGMQQSECNSCDLCTGLACANCLCGGMGGC